LFDGVKHSNNPFYDFFDLHELDEFKLDDAVALLNHIAKLEGNNDLASFIQSPTGRDRIKVVHYLSGGSPRVYIVFSAFLMTPESLDKLVEPFMEMLDSLTPYYQDRMKYLSNQQRKIVDFLCDRGGAAPVKEIAKRCFIEQRTVSSQLKDLRDKGYVKTEEIGRESWYELREPLMRFCLEVKKQRNQPIRLIVDFIRVWYTRKELQQRLGLRMADVDGGDEESNFMYRPGLKPIPPDAVMEREYYTRALEAIERNEEDPRLKAYFDEIKYCIEQKDYVSALEYAEKLVTSRGEARDWVEKGHCLNRLKRYDEALECLDKAIESDSNYARAWANRGDVLDNLKRYDEALVSYDRVIELDANYKWAWCNRGNVLSKLKRFEESLESFDRALELDVNDKLAWISGGNLLMILERYEEALVFLDRVLELHVNDKWAWASRGDALDKLKRYEEALESFDRALELDANYKWDWAKRGNILNKLKRYEEALESFDRALELDANYKLDWTKRGDVLHNLERYEEALKSYDRAIELDANYKFAWAKRGHVLYNLKRYEEALVSFDRAIELDANYKFAWTMRGYILGKRGYFLGKQEYYQEALLSFNKRIEIDEQDDTAWNNRGWVLCRLGRYDQALISLEKAIELGFPKWYAFFNRAESLLGLNQWDEGITALDDAIYRFTQADMTEIDNTEAIVRNLFNNTSDIAICKTRIKTLIELYNKHNVISILGQGIVQNIPALMPEMVSDKAARTWLELWQEPTSNCQEFKIPIRLLDAAVRYKETKGDRRVLLKLPIEERNLLEPLVSTKPE
jgi:tetratricopeptide (TPR) repeat protein